MTDIEQLILEVQAKGAEDTNKKLDELKGTVDKATESFGRLGEGIKKGLEFAGVAVSLNAIYNSLKDATLEYQHLEAQLTRVTGSQEGANKALEAIEDIALHSKNSVQDITDAFSHLVLVGLNPSEAALKSYSNTAKLFGTSLPGVVDAVVGATQGMFRGLHEYGIQAEKDGNDIAFTFRGNTTTVKNSADAIQNYIIALGNANVANKTNSSGAQSLAMVMDQLEKNWKIFWEDVSKAGGGSLITAPFQLALTAVQELNAELQSGQLETKLKLYAEDWKTFATGADEAFTDVSAFLSMAVVKWGKLEGTAADDMAAMWKDPIHSFQDGIEVLTAGVVRETAKSEITWKGFVANLKALWDEFIEDLQASTSLISAAVTGDFAGVVSSGGAAAGKIAEVHQKFSDLHDARDKATSQELNATDMAFGATMDAIGTEITERHDNVEAINAESAAKRKQYDDDKKNRDAGNAPDRLGGFQKPTGPNTGIQQKDRSAEEEAKRQAALQKQLLEENLKSVEQGQLVEGQAIAAGYDQQKKIILESTKLTNDQKKSMILAALSNSIMSEEDQIKDSYDRRQEYILSATELTEDQKTKLMLNLTRSREEAIRNIEQTTMTKRLDQASIFFGNIASIGSTFGKKGFEIAKAAGIAKATIDTFNAATAAYSALAGVPYIGPELGAAAAAAAIVAGAANIAKIKAQSYQAAYEMGGMISSGRYGLVGEAGPEFVQGPAIVTSARNTASSLSSNSRSVQSVTIHNHGQPVEATSEQNGDNLLLVLKPILAKHKTETKDELAQEVSRGGSKFSRTLEQTYGLPRSGRRP